MGEETIVLSVRHILALALVILSTLASSSFNNLTAKKDQTTSTHFERLSEAYRSIYKAKYNSLFEKGTDFIVLSHGVVLEHHNHAGWGNIAYALVTVTGLGVASKRIGVFTNALVNKMFQHPDSQNDVSNAPVNNSIIRHKINNEHVHVTKLAPCGSVDKWEIKTWKTMTLVMGCYGNNLMHHEVREVLAPLLGIEHMIRGTKVHDFYFPVMISLLFQYTFSNTTPLFRKLYQLHSTKIECAFNKVRKSNQRNDSGEHFVDDSSVVDIVVQIRTFSDINNDGYPPIVDTCYKKCVINKIETYGKNNVHMKRPIRIYITSDNCTASESITAFVNNNLTFNAIAINNYMIYNNNDSHSSGSFDKLKDFAQDVDLQNRNDLLDWMIISHADTAIYTKDSTFSQSARLRSGLYKQRHDIRVELHGQNMCICSKFIPINTLCDICNETTIKICPDNYIDEC